MDLYEELVQKLNLQSREYSLDGLVFRAAGTVDPLLVVEYQSKSSTTPIKLLVDPATYPKDKETGSAYHPILRHPITIRSSQIVNKEDWKRVTTT